jgi:hypothetical protein
MHAAGLRGGRLPHRGIFFGLRHGLHQGQGGRLLIVVLVVLVVVVILLLQRGRR